MPYKDRERALEYWRERYAKLKEEDPEYLEEQKRLQREKYQADQAFREKKRIQARVRWERTKARLESDPEFAEEYRRKTAERSRKSWNKTRMKTIMKYGSVCVCCGEINTGFLTMDHINSDGALHRKETKSRYRDMLENYRPDLYQVLCYNCNCGRYFNGGVCPHV